MSCCCEEILCSLKNRKVIICSGNTRCCVVVCDVCPGYIKAIEVGCGSVRIFNLDNISYIEEL